MKPQITDEQFEREIQSKLVLAFAQAASPRLLHQMAMTWNWDNDEPFLLWLIENPNTDKATALMVYWKYGPRYWKQFHDREDAVKRNRLVRDFDIVENIEAKYLSGYYKQQQLFFDPNSEDVDGTIWANEYSHLPAARAIPAAMLQRLEGEAIEEPENFEEGMPPELVEQIEEAYNSYDIIED